MQGNAHWGQALAQILSSGVAGHQDYLANTAEQENNELKNQEMSQLASIMQGGAAPPLRPGVMPDFQHPEVAEAALAHVLRSNQAQQAAELRAAGNSGEYGVSPVWLQNEDGSYGMGQMNKAGGMQMVDIPEGYSVLPDSGRMGFDPRMIATQGEAETAAEVNNIEQTATPQAQAAAEQAQAVGEAETDIALDRQDRMYQQERSQELEENRRAAFNRLSTQADQIGNVTAIADKVLSQASGWTTGLLGSMLSWAPGSPQRDLAENLKTLESNAAFDKLQSMRDLSPTGGALGQVSERELDLLKSSWSALSQSQSETQFKENVQRFKDQVEQSWARVIEAYEQDFGQPYFQTAPESPVDGLSNEPVDQLDVLYRADAILGL